jgi:hypothetical protein
MILTKVVEGVTDAVKCIKDCDKYAYIRSVNYVMIEQKWWEILILWRQPKYRVTYILETPDETIEQKAQRKVERSARGTNANSCSKGRCCKMPEMQ